MVFQLLFSMSSKIKLSSSRKVTADDKADLSIDCICGIHI